MAVSIEMHLEFLDKFKDPYMREKNPVGRGVFLAGIVFGMIAWEQKKKIGCSIDATPMYKQLHFGRMLRRDLRHLMGRVPELTRAYDIPNAWRIESLCGEAGKLLLEGESKDLGVDGNFVFTVAFLNAWDYFSKIFSDDGPSDKGQQLDLFGELNDESGK